MAATRPGHLSVVEMLLENGARLDLQDHVCVRCICSFPTVRRGVIDAAWYDRADDGV